MLFDNLDYEFFLPQHMFKKAKELSDEKVSLIRLSRPQLITIHNVPSLLLLGRLLKSLKYVKEKYFQVNIAVATYEMIDKHIRKLDSDLAKFESEMKVSSSVSSTSFTTVFVQDKGRLSQSESEEEEVVNKKKMKDKKKKGVKEEDNKKKKKAKKVRRRWKERRLCNVFVAG